jgi:biotin-(acetyl-CoA carboxylase) ligase
LNVNQKDLPRQAISLSTILGMEAERTALMETISALILAEYNKLREGGWQTTRSGYLSRLYRLARPAWYTLPDGSRFQAMLKSVGEQGELILLCHEGEKKFQFKEVGFEL